MKILVTGGAGFVGYNLCKKLIEDGHDVISIDNYSTGKKQNEIDGVTYFNSDIAYGINKTIVEGVEAVVHLAASARIQPSFSDPILFARNNVIGTFYVCELCRELKIPLVFAGTSSHHSGKYKNPYTFTKDLSEETIKLYQQIFELKGSIARFYNVYGPHQLEEGNATLIGIWDKANREGSPFYIFGDGSKRRDFTHVEDIVDALILIIKKEAWGEVFELGRGNNFSVKEIAKMYDYDNIIYKEDKEGEAQDTLCDLSLAKNILGWNPTKKIEDWIK
jgi:UDP-glucose 4-epimerase